MHKIIYVVVRHDKRKRTPDDERTVCLIAFDSEQAAKDQVEAFVNDPEYDKKIDFFIDEVEFVEITKN